METARLILDDNGELETCRLYWENQKNDDQVTRKIFKNIDVVFDLLRKSYNFSEEDHKKAKFSILSNKIYEKLKELGYPDIYGSSTHPEFKDALAGKYK